MPPRPTPSRISDATWEQLVSTDRVLVVDDCRSRLFCLKEYHAIPEWATHAGDAHEGIARMEPDSWDAIWLDHDLATHTPDGKAVTGLDVTRALIDRIPPGPGAPKIIVHSTNLEGARSMMAALREAGFEPIRVAITDIFPLEGLD